MGLGLRLGFGLGLGLAASHGSMSSVLVPPSCRSVVHVRVGPATCCVIVARPAVART